jgi:hypothetical protein
MGTKWNSASLCNTNESLQGAALKRSSEQYLHGQRKANQEVFCCLNLSEVFKIHFFV